MRLHLRFHQAAEEVMKRQWETKWTALLLVLYQIKVILKTGHIVQFKYEWSLGLLPKKHGYMCTSSLAQICIHLFGCFSFSRKVVSVRNFAATGRGVYKPTKQSRLWLSGPFLFQRKSTLICSHCWASSFFNIPCKPDVASALLWVRRQCLYSSTVESTHSLDGFVEKT